MALVLKRIDDDRCDALPDPVTFEKVIAHLSDWTLWAYGEVFNVYLGGQSTNPSQFQVSCFYARRCPIVRNFICRSSRLDRLFIS